jgi:hypothetical protein
LNQSFIRVYLDGVSFRREDKDKEEEVLVGIFSTQTTTRWLSRKGMSWPHGMEQHHFKPALQYPVQT